MSSLQVSGLHYDGDSLALRVEMTDGSVRLHLKVLPSAALALARTKRKYGGYAGYATFSRNHPHRVIK